jgi:hypothetical protein
LQRLAPLQPILQQQGRGHLQGRPTETAAIALAAHASDSAYLPPVLGAELQQNPALPTANSSTCTTQISFPFRPALTQTTPPSNEASAAAPSNNHRCASRRCSISVILPASALKALRFADIRPERREPTEARFIRHGQPLSCLRAQRRLSRQQRERQAWQSQPPGNQP